MAGSGGGFVIDWPPLDAGERRPSLNRDDVGELGARDLIEDDSVHAPGCHLSVVQLWPERPRGISRHYRLRALRSWPECCRLQAVVADGRHSSSSSELPFTQEITGSNPVGGMVSLEIGLRISEFGPTFAHKRC